MSSDRTISRWTAYAAVRRRALVLCGTLSVALSASALGCDSAAKSPSEPVNAPAVAIPADAPADSPDPAAAAVPAATGADAGAAAPSAATGASAGDAADAEPEAAAAQESAGESGEAAQADEAEAGDAAAEVEPTRVLVIGDSLIATGFGVLVEKGLDAHPAVTCYRKGKSASGLARPDFFDWMGEAKKQIEFRKPQVVVAVMGGNDGQDLRPRSGKGRGVTWPSDAWKTGYRERMDALLAELGAEGRQIIWVALPPMGMRSLEKKLVTIREIQRQAVADFGERASYIETAPMLTDDEGKLLTYGKVKGKKREIRADDGIHFTMSGSQYFADQVVPQLLNQMGISNVED